MHHEPTYDALVNYIGQVFGGTQQAKQESRRRLLPLPHLDLQVTLIQADGIEAGMPTASYCTLDTTEHHKRIRSSVQVGTGSHTWNQRFFWDLTNAEETDVRVNVWKSAARTRCLRRPGTSNNAVRRLIREVSCLTSRSRDKLVGSVTVSLRDIVNHSEEWYPLKDASSGRPLSARLKLGISIITGPPIEHHFYPAGVEEHVTLAYMFLRHRVDTDVSSSWGPWTFEGCLCEEAMTLLSLHARIRDLLPVERSYSYLRAALCVGDSEEKVVTKAVLVDLTERVESGLKSSDSPIRPIAEGLLNKMHDL